MITVEGLTKTFGSRHAVDNLSFELARGKVIGFLGPNGAGKSTTMRMMLDVTPADRGTVLFDGQPYRSLQYPSRVVGALLDASAVHPARTARNHLRSLAAASRLPDTRVDELLELVGLSSVARTRVGGFSLGMHQRLGLAVALMGDPTYLLLDEPTNGLDPEGIRWARTLMRHAADRGVCVFVSSHLLSELSQVCDELLVIAQGRLITHTSMAEFTTEGRRTWVLVDSPRQDDLATLLSSRGASVERDPSGPLRVLDLNAAVVGDLAAANGIALHQLTTEGENLEDVFLRVTEGEGEYASAPVSAPPVAAPPAAPPPAAPPAAPPGAAPPAAPAAAPSPPARPAPPPVPPDAPAAPRRTPPPPAANRPPRGASSPEPRGGAS